MPPQEFLWYFSIFCWQDIVEIVFFAGSIFYLSLWLKQDTNQSLLAIFYGYCGAFLMAYHLELFTVSTALITFAPIAVAICLILHQSTLQKNFIALHNITTATNMREDWLEIIMRSALVALGENKPLTGVIEKKQALDTLITSDHPFDCPVSEGLFHVLLHSAAFNTQKMIWIDHNGKLKAINATWKKNSVDEWLAQEVKEQGLESKFKGINFVFDERVILEFRVVFNEELCFFASGFNHLNIFDCFHP